MAFVALSPITLNGADGGQYTISPGEIVPEFDTWPIHSRRAYVRHFYVKEVPEDEAEAVEAKPDLEPMAEVVACPHCPGKTFASRRGLAIHVGQQHR